MNKKGFTLIELLAVIVVLAILALITTAVISNVIESARKKTFGESAQGIYRAIELDYTENGYSNTQNYTISDGEITNTTANPDYTITYEGSVNNASGTAVATYDSTNGKLVINMELENSNYCATNASNTNKKEFDVTKGECEWKKRKLILVLYLVL